MMNLVFDISYSCCQAVQQVDSKWIGYLCDVYVFNPVHLRVFVSTWWLRVVDMPEKLPSSFRCIFYGEAFCTSACRFQV